MKRNMSSGLNFTQKISIPCLIWLIGVGVVAAGRIAAAIYFNLNFMRYSLFYFFLRLFEVWCVYMFYNAAKKLEVRRGKRKSRSRRRTRNKLVPITYYGVVRKLQKHSDSEEDDLTVVSAPDGDSNKSYVPKYIPKNNQK